MLSRDGTNIVEAIDPDDLFVRGDLENRIGRRVEDRFAGADMLGAEFLKNGRAALRIVTDELHTGISLDRADEFVGKTVEGRKRFVENNASNFPVPGGGVLAGGAFLHLAVAPPIGRIGPI
jgi:hypothetical protein